MMLVEINVFVSRNLIFERFPLKDNETSANQEQLFTEKKRAPKNFY